MIGWERAFIVLFMIFLYRNRRVIGHFLSSALELLSEYNDQYDHGEPPPTAPKEGLVGDDDDDDKTAKKDEQMRTKVD
jgi:hypothetical protein